MYTRTKICKFCGTTFTPKRKHGEYCKESHRIAAYKKRNNIPIPDFSLLQSKLVPSKLELKKIELNSVILEAITKLGRLDRESKRDLDMEQAYTKALEQKRKHEENKDPAKRAGKMYIPFIRDITDFELKRAEETTLQAIQRLKPVREEKMELLKKIEKWQKELADIEHNLFIDKNKTGKKLSDAAALSEEVFESLEFTGNWKELLGRPEKGFTAIIYGEKFGGKSTFALKLADYLTGFGKVIYFSVEEGVKMTMQNKLKALGITNAKLKISAEQLPEAIMKMAKQFDFAIIDSLTTANITADDLRNAKLANAKTAYIGINHITTDGRAKGGTGQLHNPDIVIKIEPIGLPIIEKNRYSEEKNTA